VLEVDGSKSGRSKRWKRFGPTENLNKSAKVDRTGPVKHLKNVFSEQSGDKMMKHYDKLLAYPLSLK
jgi:hypothetical protein